MHEPCRVRIGINSVLSEGTVHRPQELLLGEACCILWLWVLKRCVASLLLTRAFYIVNVNRASARGKHTVKRPHYV